MKKIFSVMFLCVALVLASCSKDEETIPVAGVTLDKTTLSLVESTKATLIATVTSENLENKNVIWASSDTTVATVSEIGEVTAVKVGTATITVTMVADNTKKATCAVTVTKEAIPVSGVTLGKTTLSLTIGGKDTLTVSVAPADATEKTVTWVSSDTTVVTVSATGEVVAIKAGTAIITVTSVADKVKTSTCSVTVTETSTLEWAVGNLVADGPNGAKIGAPTDRGLYFQFGSLVGFSSDDSLSISVKPADCTVTEFPSKWLGDATTENTITGTGDPCKYYLKGTWRLPTNEEFKKLFENPGWPTTGPWTWTSSSASHTSGMIFPAAGYRASYDDINNGELENVGKKGYYWSSSPSIDPESPNHFFCLIFNNKKLEFISTLYPSEGISVRCVKDK